ncbi:hypothetical protein MTP10_38210 [Nonomuraea sp. 3-1Str]|uniref:hypothetical protein n=1 Tax=Nonomuraea sp. 3-1Str TaxID=2929801 RepID=UPI0028603653|nr:hypothetical protein [Nonomuraea sp. 3-1Str]MDR8414548.1 hypothetical protein [Nonomuraea sp. 3-1Str]
MPKTALAAAGLAAAVTLLIPATATASASAGGSGTPLRLRDGLTLSLPGGWKVYGKGDWIRVVTGSCPKPGSGYAGSECDSFWILGPKAIELGGEVFEPYTAERPFYPATDVQPCPHDRRWGERLGAARVKGLRQVGPGHKAYYREWKATCVTYDGAEVRSRWIQREWYLPRTKVLVVDQWNTPGLAGVLKRATWR